MTRNFRATSTCPSRDNGSVSGSVSTVRPLSKSADRLDNAFNFQARKRRLRGVLSTLIPRVSRRRLGAMNAHATAQSDPPLNAKKYRHASRLVGVKHLVGRYVPGSGGYRPAWGRGPTAGMPGGRDG